MRKVKQIRDRVLSHPGRYKEVWPKNSDPEKPAPLKVKQVEIDGCRYIVCVNPAQQRKDAADRQAIVDALAEQIKKGPKSLVGNKGFRKYLKIEKNSASIDESRVKYESRFDGKWVLKTNTTLTAEQVALKYKELWQVEVCFKKSKQLLELGKDQSNDFNAQVTATTLSFIRYNILNYLNKVENHGTLDCLFEHIADTSGVRNLSNNMCT